MRVMNVDARTNTRHLPPAARLASVKMFGNGVWPWVKFADIVMSKDLGRMLAKKWNNRKLKEMELELRPHQRRVSWRLFAKRYNI